MRLNYTNIKNNLINGKYKSLIEVGIFAVITLVFHYLWWHGLKSFLLDFAAFKDMEAWLAHQVFVSSAWIVEDVLNYNISTEGNTIFIDKGYVAVLGSCSGLKQFYQWTVLMLLFPGPWKHKLWFIPSGIIVINIVNILRIVILSLIVVYWPQQWDFIHEWVLRPFFYVVIFAMWVIWVEKVRK